MNRRYVMAIEADAAQARCVVADVEGHVVGSGVGAAPEDDRDGWTRAQLGLRSAVAAAVAAVGRELPAIESIAAGVAGVGFEGERAEEIESLLAEVVPQATRVRAWPDLVIAFWGALPMPVGVVVCAGTGAACFARNVTGDTCTVGGWGPLLGDEGSAYDIGRKALRAVARAEDGRGRATALSLLLARHFDVHDTVDLALALDAQPPGRDVIAGLFPQVVQAARRGDTVALQILHAAARDLGIAVATALRRLHLLELRTSVSFSGDVFEAGRILIEPFTVAVREATPHAQVEAPLLPPIGGAYRLALQALSVTMDEPIVFRFAKGLVRNGW